MPYYRLYHFSEYTGGIARFDEFEAADDKAAADLAAARMNGRAMELWQQQRRVRRFDPPRPGSPAAAPPKLGHAPGPVLPKSPHP